MSPLLSNSALESLRELALSGMQTDIYISDHSVELTIDGSADVWTERTTSIKGWMHSTPTPVMSIIGGEQATVNTYRLFLPVGTDINVGDRIRIGTTNYTVSDTDAESTWLPMLTVSLRRVE